MITERIVGVVETSPPRPAGCIESFTNGTRTRVARVAREDEIRSLTRLACAPRLPFGVHERHACVGIVRSLNQDLLQLATRLVVSCLPREHEAIQEARINIFGRRLEMRFEHRERVGTIPSCRRGPSLL